MVHIPMMDSFDTQVPRAEIVRLLIESGSDARVTSTEIGDSALHLSVKYFNEDDALETAKLLVAHGCDPLEVNSLGETPLRIAIRRGHVSVAGYLRSLGIPLPP
ncbi:hypothetical protein OG21DRAFT_1515561, partial [Imleria badia]